MNHDSDSDDFKSSNDISAIDGKYLGKPSNEYPLDGSLTPQPERGY